VRTVNAFYFEFEKEYLRDHDEIPNSFYDAHRLDAANPAPKEWGWELVVAVVKDGPVISEDLKEGVLTARQAT
jgi:hypothetical protein